MSEAEGGGDFLNQAMVVVTLTLGTFMVTLDSTIANVALPYMQGSVSAAPDQITWVLTSYIVATAIITPMTGWLAGRFGRRSLFLLAIGGFTFASALCGLADSLGELVGFRLLQGLFGAPLIPLSQSILLDSFPPRRHGQMIAIWSMGVLIGPIVGPVLGGWLTEQYGWRSIFYINLPFGLIALPGILIFIKEHKHAHGTPFDFMGFGLLSVAIGALQLFVDRGPGQDWFYSGEVRIEAALAGVCMLLFVIHSLTAEHPFFNPRLFVDRNYVIGCLFGFMIGLILFATMALMPSMLETLLGYPVITTGLITAPRGMTSLASMFVLGLVIGKIDARLLIAAGVCLSAVAQFMMTHFTLQMDPSLAAWSAAVHGASMGLIFVPITTMAFATLPAHLRTEAASLFSVLRNLGSSIGISVMQLLLVRNAAAVHSRLVENLRPDNPLARAPYLHAPYSLVDPHGLAALNAEVTRQSLMVAYVDNYWLMSIIALGLLPMLFLLRMPKRASAATQPSMVVD